MRISDWSSDVCSSDLDDRHREMVGCEGTAHDRAGRQGSGRTDGRLHGPVFWIGDRGDRRGLCRAAIVRVPSSSAAPRSEEHTSELQSLMRISYAVFCLKKKNQINTQL